MADVLSSLHTRTRPYRAVLASRMRSQRSYRANFVVDLVYGVIDPRVRVS